MLLRVLSFLLSTLSCQREELEISQPNQAITIAEAQSLV